MHFTSRASQSRYLSGKCRLTARANGLTRKTPKPDDRQDNAMQSRSKCTPSHCGPSHGHNRHREVPHPRLCVAVFLSILSENFKMSWAPAERYFRRGPWQHWAGAKDILKFSDRMERKQTSTHNLGCGTSLCLWPWGAPQ